MQMYKVIIVSPIIAKFLIGLIIDAKIVPRKILNIISNLIISLLLFGVGFKFFNTPKTIVTAMFFATLFHQVVDGTL